MRRELDSMPERDDWGTDWGKHGAVGIVGLLVATSPPAALLWVSLSLSAA